jgi:hypothetical protein
MQNNNMGYLVILFTTIDSKALRNTLVFDEMQREG